MGNFFSFSPYLPSNEDFEYPLSTRPPTPTPEDPTPVPVATIPEPEPELPLSIFSGVESVAPTGCPAPTDFNFLSFSFVKKEKGFLAYTLSVTDERVCFFTASSYNIIESSRHEISLADLVKGEIYHIEYLTHSKMGPWSSLCEQTRLMYSERRAFVCENLVTYRELILPALLVGWRIRDYEQRCATVVQMGELRLSMTSQKGKWLERIKLKTTSGEKFTVAVTGIIKDEDDKKWTVVCLELQKLPSSVRQGCHLEIVDDESIWQSPVPSALFAFFSTKKTATTARPIDNWPLLERIYGSPSHCVLPHIPIGDYSIRLTSGGTIKLNPQQAEAVARYNSSSIPAFAIEAPPGSGKTMTAAALAVSYRGNGVQLFLSTANIAVNNMALSLGKLEIGTRSPLHLMSSEGRMKLAEQAESPFSSLSLAKNQEKFRVKIEAIENRIIEKGIHEKEQRDEQGKDIYEACLPILDEPHDIYFATIDTIVKRMTKPNKDGHHQEDTIKRQLENEVERIVIDEASQLTEAALNALILHFPKAQIVLIGDSKQLPPFKYTKGEIISELAHRSSIDVVKDKNNIPVIKLHEVYRASQLLISHYSDVFYEGKLKSKKNEVENPLACFGVTSRRLFWKVKNGDSTQDGTSKVNHREIETLVQIVTKLRESNITEKDVMIISYYEAQRKKAAKMLKKYWKGYEVLTVDSAQGREKRIVIVLTTRTSVPAEAGENFFNSAKRCNVAVSRHQEALIVIGHPSIATVPNWTQVLTGKYFKYIENDNHYCFPHGGELNRKGRDGMGRGLGNFISEHRSFSWLGLHPVRLRVHNHTQIEIFEKNVRSRTFGYRSPTSLPFPSEARNIQPHKTFINAPLGFTHPSPPPALLR